MNSKNSSIRCPSLKGKTVADVDQWYLSSKTCNHCKHVLKSLPLDVRRCPSCQTVNDWDGVPGYTVIALAISGSRLDVNIS